MIERIRELLKPVISDENVLMVSVYRIDGTPVFVDAKRKEGVLDVIYWLERQIKTLINYISMGIFNEAEFKFKNYYILLYPISKTLILGILSSDEASAYKLRIDAASIKEQFKIAYEI